MPFASRCASLAAPLLLWAAVASAETLELAPRRAAGDVYALSLDTTNASSLYARGAKRGADTETGALHYEANVAVLAVDDGGRPLHERHVDVVVRSQADGEATSLFREPVAFDVHRAADGDVEIHASDARIDRSLEKRIAALLAAQFETSLAPALLAPGRDVALGDHWELDPAAARRFLRSQGVRAIELGGPATATLATRSDGQALVLRYQIPVSWWTPRPLPKHASPGESQARFEGEVELVADGVLRPSRHVAVLRAEASGVLVASGYSAPAPWRLATESTTEQRTRVVRRALAANF